MGASCGAVKRSSSQDQEEEEYKKKNAVVLKSQITDQEAVASLFAIVLLCVCGISCLRKEQVLKDCNKLPVLSKRAVQLCNPGEPGVFPRGCFPSWEAEGEMGPQASFKGKDLGKNKRECLQAYSWWRGPQKKRKKKNKIKPGRIEFVSSSSRPDYSIFVGELTPEVDDFQLYDYFLKRYPSCIDCKIATDLLGYSRGYAFVRFGEQGDQMRALQDCQNAPGLGGKRIRLSIGISKRLKAEFQRYQSYNYNDYYQDYQNYYSQWNYDPYADYNYSSYAPYDSMQAVGDCSLGDAVMAPAVFEETSAMAEINDDLIIEDPQLHLDIDEMNRQFMETSEELYDSLMNCHWQPLDTVTSDIPFAI
ncbi:tRNA selenocysteine 1-associated protein 1-like isoform X2 [Rhea pennata]|uniref:tRNA selenocysteine 1-associated protein 1-like isoform X2 n=1 Tax=Rhea pennata TaxID=8795 RepID=UPI002E26D9EA